MMNTLHVNQLCKRYGSQVALDRVDLIVASGQIFGLLGPNGSGKTTLLGIVLDVLRADSGGFTWFGGAPPSNPRRRIGGLLEHPNFYPYLNADQNLRLVASIKGVSPSGIPALLEMTGLLPRRKSPFRTYSLGMKQRLAIAACLVGDPEVLILDEPTNGLDPAGMIEVRRVIQSIAAQGKTILLASHLLDEVEKICSHVGILKAGRLLASGPVGAILSNDRIVEVSCVPPDMERLHQLVQSIPGVRNICRCRENWSLEVSPSLEPSEINRLAFENGIVLTLLHSQSRSLESEFLEITR